MNEQRGLQPPLFSSVTMSLFLPPRSHMMVCCSPQLSWQTKSYLVPDAPHLLHGVPLLDALGFLSISTGSSEVRNARIFPLCLTSARESAGEKQEAFLPTGPQHGVSKLAMLRKGRWNQPPARNGPGIFRSFSSLCF
jgi:hypothetical protein